MQIMKGKKKMSEKKTSEAQLKSAKKWDEMNAGQIGIKAKKGEIEECKEYAKSLNMTTSKFAMKAMKYCIKNKIEFNNEEN